MIMGTYMITVTFDNKKDIKRFLRKRAVLSIEAAFCIPFFLMAMISIMSILTFSHINICLREAVNESVKYAEYNYDNGVYIHTLETLVKADLAKKINEKYIENGIDGLDFSESDFSDDEIIDLKVKYTGNVPFNLIKDINPVFYIRAISHKDNGYTDGLSGYVNSNNLEYVYITYNSSVYHMSKNCSHIKLAISQTDSKNVKKLRNLNGHKYYPCEVCKSSLKDNVLYVTDDGTKYHNDITCSGLKRSVRRVTMEKALGEGKRACNRCGG